MNYKLTWMQWCLNDTQPVAAYQGYSNLSWPVDKNAFHFKAIVCHKQLER